MTYAKMDVASNDDSLTEVEKYFVIHTDRELPQKLEDRENVRIFGTHSQVLLSDILGVIGKVDNSAVPSEESGQVWRSVTNLFSHYVR